MELHDISPDFLVHEREGQHFDRKSARIKPKDIAKTIAAFANAEGGILAVGIEDNGEITGFDYDSACGVEEFRNAPYQFCQPLPKFKTREIEVINARGKNDVVLLLQVETSADALIRTLDDKVFLRTQDRCLALTHDQIAKLEYDRGQRVFEDREVPDSSMEDVDPVVMSRYREALGTSASDRQILESRGFLKNGHLTNAGLLLFSKYPGKYLPQARLRFLRYDGDRAKTGEHINIIKERTFDGPIPAIIDQARTLINAQLREFQFLTSDGTFRSVPEYPEFAWLEGMVNALTHRDYSFAGDHIRIVMYDDRLEIFSPGKLPNVVTLENMRTTRYARNPRIARALTELGWVKELNEGVRRIYDEMQSFFLHDPIYTEPGYAVLLTLENSITSRHLRSAEKMETMISPHVLDALNETEFNILRLVYACGRTTLKEAQTRSGATRYRCRNALQALVDKGLLEQHGSGKKDPQKYYTLGTSR